jgi:hypothetical protein
MLMEENKKLIDKTVAEGGVYATLYFDIHTKSKEKAQEIGAGFVETLLKEPGAVYAIGEIDEPIQNEDLYSTTVEVKFLAKSFAHLTNVVAIHSPFSIEIIAPDEVHMSLDQAHTLLTNVSTTTSDYKKYILEKVTSQEELEKYQRILEQKAELGKRLLEKKEAEK